MTKLSRDSKGRFVSTKNTNKGEMTMNKTVEINVPFELKKGDKLVMTFGEDEKPAFTRLGNVVIGAPVSNAVVSKVFVDIASEIDDKGYVYDLDALKRWVMAQMFRALTYVDDNGNGYDYFYKTKKNYNYQWKVTFEKIEELIKDKESNPKMFEEEKNFFNKEMVDRMLADHITLVCDAVRNKYVCFKKASGYLGWKKYTPTEAAAISETINGRYLNIVNTMNINEYLTKIKSFIDEFIPQYCIIAKNTKKSSAFMKCFKAYGAYYTMKNMIVGGHGCKLRNYETGKMMNAQDSIDYLVAKGKEFGSEYDYKLFAMLIKCIEDNNFKF